MIFCYFSLLSSDFDEILPKSIDSKQNVIELKPSLQVYHVATRFILLWDENKVEHRERLERLCRYLIASLDSDLAKTSYIGVALNADMRFVFKKIKSNKIFILIDQFKFKQFSMDQTYKTITVQMLCLYGKIKT